VPGTHTSSLPRSPGQPNPAAKSAAIGRSQSFEPSLSSITEDPWSWQNLPKFTGTKRLSVRRTNSNLRDTFPQLRKKPRFHASARPLVDSSYAWPDWFSDSDSDSPVKPPGLSLDEKEGGPQIHNIASFDSLD
jgi:hypothetical protein